MTRPLRHRACLQLDESRLRLTPCGIGGGNTCTRSPRVACVSDCLLELPASRLQRGGVLHGGLRGITSPLLLELGTITLSPLTLRGLPQVRGELLDRVLRLDRR